MENKRRYYVCSVGEPGKDYVEANFDRIIENRAFILHQDTIQKGLYYDIKPKDILLLKYNHHFVAYGEVEERLETEDDEWNLWATVLEWHFKDKINRSVGVHKYGIQDNTLEGGGQMGTVKGIEEDFALEKINEIDAVTPLYLKINSEFIEAKKNENMKATLDLLNYKKQIILQGPPGTGKTKLAKELALEKTKPLFIENHLDKINKFFKDNIFASSEKLAKRKLLEPLLHEFQDTFPKENIANLAIEKYAFGKGNNDTFCWWLEYGLYDLGGYTGQAGKFKLFWKKSIDAYDKIGFIKDVEDDDEAMKLIGEQLDNIVNERNLAEASKKLSNGFILKILHSYFPNKYFPINNEKCINNGLILLGKKVAGLNVFEKNLELQKAFEEKREEFKADITNYEFMDFMFKSFDMKGTITIEESKLVTKGDYKIIQFHPAYSYEDFVRGISAETNEKNQVEYTVTNRIIAEMAQEAFDNPSSSFILIIDEINRANLPAVLGELIYAFEYRFDENNEKDTTVDSMYALKESAEDESGNRKLRIPKNLYIIGTMNTADRSIGHIDYAIRRRFAFVDVLPTPDPIKDFAKPVFKKVSELFVKNYDTIDWNNPKLERSAHLATDFRPEDVWIGHSYFITKEKDDQGNLINEQEQLNIKLKYEIIPILKEYVKDGILLESALAEIEKL